MSSLFDQMRAKHVPPSANYGDYLGLPELDAARRRREEEAAERGVGAHEVATEAVEAEREAVGGHGGSGGGAETAATPASAPEALPQRDEPDEGEHGQSTAAAEPEPKPEPVVEEPPVAPVEVEAPPPPEPSGFDDEPEGLVEGPDDEVAPVQPKQLPEGAQQLVWTKVAFTHDGDGKHVRDFPAVLLEALRAQLAPFGKEFAQEVSNSALVSAFVAAHLGLDIGADEGTRQAIRAFMSLSPELESLERRVGGTEEQLAGLVKELVGLRRDVRAATEVARTVELSNALVFTDRFERVVEPGTAAKDVELRTPKVLRTRNHLREEAAKQRESDQRRERHP